MSITDGDGDAELGCENNFETCFVNAEKSGMIVGGDWENERGDELAGKEGVRVMYSRN